MSECDDWPERIDKITKDRDAALKVLHGILEVVQNELVRWPGASGLWKIDTDIRAYLNAREAGGE